jgi:glycosyltransferase involved in cell wall biosynthesis
LNLGASGLLASSIEEWVAGLSSLIEFEELRAEMGLAAYDYASQKFSREIAAKKAAELFQICC